MGSRRNQFLAQASWKPNLSFPTHTDVDGCMRSAYLWSVFVSKHCVSNRDDDKRELKYLGKKKSFSAKKLKGKLG